MSAAHTNLEQATVKLSHVRWWQVMVLQLSAGECSCDRQWWSWGLERIDIWIVEDFLLSYYPPTCCPIAHQTDERRRSDRRTDGRVSETGDLLDRIDQKRRELAEERRRQERRQRELIGDQTKRDERSFRGYAA
jgi:hypothetical protein